MYFFMMVLLDPLPPPGTRAGCSMCLDFCNSRWLETCTLCYGIVYVRSGWCYQQIRLLQEIEMLSLV
jgi:hypothetical protein